jgi:hypothetical protein
MESNLDPILGTEIMSSLGISHDELSIPKNLNKFKEIYHFFKDYPNPTNKITRLAASRPGVDRMDIVWTWVELQRQKAELVTALSSFGDTPAPEMEEEMRETQNRYDVVRREIEAY